ncbi:hypothetical protein [Chryseobacterium oryctis]|uniref:Uncharacterized protein n=1 Tax=Chryseobacterium oryctis TaxID=2952618 RepID=A0ABT3HRF6_9FLAO|nr:hypothetical protein [Chryseobacterium oryctis]MCW3162368.1 hypothetical protein [Chryseobacterium oryctis]
MKKFFISGFMLFASFFSIKAQVGINSQNPQASLHMEPNNASSPSGKDGILVPRVNNFPTAQAKGHIVFLTGHASLPDNFYYWDGDEWVVFLNSFVRTYDDSIYIVTGVGYSASGDTENNVLFNTIKGYDTTGFTVSGNQVKVGKSGKYLVSFNSALKKDAGTANRAIYTYRIKKNGSMVLSTSNSIPNEATTASSVAVSGILDLAQNDMLSATVQKTTETGSTDYVGYGTNCLTLTYLND